MTEVPNLAAVGLRLAELQRDLEVAPTFRDEVGEPLRAELTPQLLVLRHAPAAQILVNQVVARAQRLADLDK